MNEKMFYVKNTLCNPCNGYLIAFGKNMWSWGNLDNAMKLTQKQLNSFMKKYEGGDPIVSVECNP